MTDPTDILAQQIAMTTGTEEKKNESDERLKQPGFMELAAINQEAERAEEAKAESITAYEPFNQLPFNKQKSHTPMPHKRSHGNKQTNG